MEMDGWRRSHDIVGSSVKKILLASHTPSFKLDTRSHIALIVN